MNRRFAVTLLLLPLLLLSFAAQAQTNAVAQIAILTDLVKSIGAAGEAITKLTAGFKNLIVAGKDSYDYVAAQRERDRLIDISRRTANLIAEHNTRLVESLEEYAALERRSPQDWRQVVRHVEGTLVLVQGLLADVQRENGSFVLEPAFLTLNQALSSRVNLLNQLASMSPPTTEEEIALVRQAGVKYKVLIANAKQAISELNTYVKEKK